MKRIAVLIGTRPEAIKMASVIAALKDSPDFQPMVINSGQHREMIDQVIELFGIEVARHLNVMEPNQTLAGLTSKLVARCDNALAELLPDMLLVQGDTTTVLCGALAAFYRHIPIGHVEAGLRTGSIAAPFPEEANRRLATTLATLHFAPTETAAKHLRREHVPAEKISITGNTVIDALQMELARQKSSQVALAIRGRLTEIVGEDLSEKPFVLVTGHRRENFGAGFEQICQALAELADRFPAHHFVYPVHLNPQVKQIVHRQLGEVANIHLISPQPYSEFVALLSWCKLVLTDSGGVQEEAPGLGKPVLVMRETTERPEGVVAGTVKLVGANRMPIVENVARLLDDETAFQAMAEAVNPYGDGHAAPQIVAAIRHFFSNNV